MNESKHETTKIKPGTPRKVYLAHVFLRFLHLILTRTQCVGSLLRALLLNLFILTSLRLVSVVRVFESLDVSLALLEPIFQGVELAHQLLDAIRAIAAAIVHAHVTDIHTEHTNTRTQVPNFPPQETP